MTNIEVFLFVFFVVILLVSSRLVFRNSSQDYGKDDGLINIKHCPNCGKPWATEKLSEELIGVFRKNELRPFQKGVFPRTSDYKMAYYEKYKIHNKCKYCNHEIISFESRKQ
jgi:hypothetical protein